jgi:hypothetical protein
MGIAGGGEVADVTDAEGSPDAAGSTDIADIADVMDATDPTDASGPTDISGVADAIAAPCGRTNVAHGPTGLSARASKSSVSACRTHKLLHRPGLASATYTTYSLADSIR